MFHPINVESMRLGLIPMTGWDQFDYRRTHGSPGAVGGDHGGSSGSSLVRER